MNPLFVVMAIRSAIRIGKTANDAFAQYAQEKPILLPNADLFDLGKEMNHVNYIVEMEDLSPEFKTLLGSDPLLKTLWHDHSPTAEPGAVNTVYRVARKFDKANITANDHLGSHTEEERAGGHLVKQWASGKGPVSPWARVVVAMADVALEFVGAHPEVLGVNGDGEKLIGAIAAAIGETIPNDTTRNGLGEKDRFSERMAALVLHSGLKAMSEQPNLVFGEEHLQGLLKNTLPPIIEALPQGDLTEQVKWRDVSDAFIGPAISKAMEAIAENPSAYLGRKYTSEKAIGVLAKGLLTAAKDIDVKDRFTKDGLLSIYKAGLSIAIANPELILGKLLDKDLSDPENRKLADTLGLSIFTSIATTLKDRKAPYSDELGTAIVIAALDGIKNTGPALFNPDNPWQKIAGDMTGQILDGFKEAFGDEAKGLEDTVFNQKSLVSLSQIFIAQVAKTPHILVGDKNDKDNTESELQRITASVAAAIGRDKDLLLTSNDWLQIAAVAAQEAAINPGRLFGLEPHSLKGQLATTVIGGLLDAAAKDLKSEDRSVGPVLIGETLRDAIIVTLRGISGNVESTFNHHKKIDELAAKLNTFIGAQGLSMGGKEWQRLFKALLPDVISKGVLPELTAEKVADLLSPKKGATT